MAPIAAGRIAVIQARQFPADGVGRSRWQWLRAYVHPGLEVTGAGFHHHAWLMPLDAPGLHYAGLGLVQIEENITGIAAGSIGLKVHVIAVAIARPQKTSRSLPVRAETPSTSASPATLGGCDGESSG